MVISMLLLIILMTSNIMCISNDSFFFKTIYKNHSLIKKIVIQNNKYLSFLPPLFIQFFHMIDVLYLYQKWIKLIEMLQKYKFGVIDGIT